MFSNTLHGANHWRVGKGMVHPLAYTKSGEDDCPPRPVLTKLLVSVTLKCSKSKLWSLSSPCLKRERHTWWPQLLQGLLGEPSRPGAACARCVRALPAKLCARRPREDRERAGAPLSSTDSSGRINKRARVSRRVGKTRVANGKKSDKEKKVIALSVAKWKKWTPQR